MSRKKTERLTNLVIGLLSTTRFVTAAEIRRTFSGYGECATDEAFQRMFERDKGELRDLGIPLSIGRNSQLADEDGYRIERSDYELPALELTPAESAAVALAGQLWHSPEMIGAFEAATVKLRAAGIPVDDAGVATVVGSMGNTPDPEPALADAAAATEAGRVVRFPHLAAGTGTTRTRTVEPWSVVSSKGRWYLVGHDVDRDATRTFRLSRITGDVETLGPAGAVTIPQNTDPQEIVRKATQEPTSPGTATLWLADEHAHDLRRIGTTVETKPLGARPGTIVEIPVGARSSTVRTIAGHGADAVVLAPDDLRTEVIGVLRSSARAHDAAGADSTPGTDASHGEVPL